MKKKQAKDPSIQREPHLRKGEFKSDPSEVKADRILDKSSAKDYSEDAQVERTVWDEPALSMELIGERPAGELTYKDWLLLRRKEISFSKTMVVTIGIAVTAGPVAIFGAFYGSGQTVLSILAITVFAPIVEEIMKVALAFYVVEKKPFYFRSSGQILLCALAGGLVFAAIENVIYLNIYIEKPLYRLVAWRWTICVALHMGCSLIAGSGLVRIWRRTWRNLERPQIALAYPFILTAAIIHGLYNAFIIALHFTSFQF